MLKEIFVDGYKSIDQESVELKPFTLFSGINSAGKSSMIQAIIMYLICKANSRIYKMIGAMLKLADLWMSEIILRETERLFSKCRKRI